MILTKMTKLLHSILHLCYAECNLLMLFWVSLSWVSLSWVLLCWVLSCWVLLCWVLFCQILILYVLFNWVWLCWVSPMLNVGMLSLIMLSAVVLSDAMLSSMALHTLRLLNVTELITIVKSFTVWGHNQIFCASERMQRLSIQCFFTKPFFFAHFIFIF